MPRQILLFLLMGLSCHPVFGQNRKQKLSAYREIVQLSAEGSATKPINHPTFTIFMAVPRDMHLQSSLDLNSGYVTLSGSWKVGITATVFWAGELPSADDPGNLTSAWDADWIETAKMQNPFYVALPYNDVANGHTKPEARTIIPWFSEAYVRDGRSVLKDHWVVIRKGAKVCYAQWEDVGPFQIDHWQYVFGNERPRPNKNRDAGIDVSPAVRNYLGLSGVDTCDWRFVSDREIPPGPWKGGGQLVSSDRLARKY
jgi:hypothetical protein